ncbi:MAG: serine protease [Candidatus Hodarchaeota archaeon]
MGPNMKENAVLHELYVEDVIVPIYITPKNDKTKMRFVGTGFYVDKRGHLITCRHVADNLDDNHWLFAYQIGKRKDLGLKVLKKSDRYDLAFCKSSPPGIGETFPMVTEQYIEFTSDVELVGYCHEPRLLPKSAPFRQRFMKGNITGIPLEPGYPDSFELSFPILFGMSGSPLICRIGLSERAFIVGCAYGSKEARIVKHSLTIERNTEGRHEQEISRIVELGLAYNPSAIFSLLKGSGTKMEVLGNAEKNWTPL